MAASHGRAVGDYAAPLLDTPLPWTKMRQVYALLGLAKKWGSERVNAACGRALELDVVNVARIRRILEAGTEGVELQPALPGTVITGRFARDPAHFALRPPDRPHPDISPPLSRTSEAIVEAAFAAALDEDAQ
jgi:hypothetical protein